MALRPIWKLSRKWGMRPTQGLLAGAALTDFEDFKLGTYGEIRDAFALVAKAPVALDGATITVSDK